MGRQCDTGRHRVINSSVDVQLPCVATSILCLPTQADNVAQVRAALSVAPLDCL